jgi:hypothetical protein
VKKRAEKKCTDHYPHFEIKDPGTVYPAPDGRVFVFVVDKKTGDPHWLQV